MDEDEPQPDGAESAEGQLIKKLVRYALACDFSRTPIRRDGIKEKGREILNKNTQQWKMADWQITVLGDQGRAFKRVFEGAQATLRSVFGMEMVELPARDKLTNEERRKGKKIKRRAVQMNHRKEDVSALLTFNFLANS